MLRQLIAASTASLSVMIAGEWTSYIAPVIVMIKNNQTDFIITPDEESWIISIMDFGNMLSTIPAGLMMDYCGRKPTLILCMILNLVASLCAISAKSGLYLFVGRLFAGLAKGVAFTVSPIYVAEISPKKIRGALGTTFYGFFCVGNILSFCAMPYMTFNSLNWLTAVIPIIVLALFAWIPDTSYYYLMKHEDDKALRSKQWFHSGADEAERKKLEAEVAEMKSEIENELQKKGSFGELLTVYSNRRALCIVLIAGVTQRLGGISYILSYGIKDLPPRENGFGPYECFSAFSIISLIAVLISAYMVDHYGRKSTLLVTTIIVSGTLYATATYYAICQDDLTLSEEYFWIPYTGVMLFAFFSTIGMGNMPAILQGELFPANVKRYASALIIIVLSFMSFVVNKTCVYVESYFGIAGMYYFSATACLLSSIYVYVYMFETKQKSFAEIQRILNEKQNSGTADIP